MLLLMKTFQRTIYTLILQTVVISYFKSCNNGLYVRSSYFFHIVLFFSVPKFHFFICIYYQQVALYQCKNICWNPHLTVLCYYAEILLVNETVMELDNSRMIQITQQVCFMHRIHSFVRLQVPNRDFFQNFSVSTTYV